MNRDTTKNIDDSRKSMAVRVEGCWCACRRADINCVGEYIGNSAIKPPAYITPKEYLTFDDNIMKINAGIIVTQAQEPLGLLVSFGNDILRQAKLTPCCLMLFTSHQKRFL